MTTCTARFAVAAAIALAPTAAGQSLETLARVGPYDAVDFAVVPRGRAGRPVLFVITRDGALRGLEIGPGADGWQATDTATLSLPDADHSLLAFADVTGDARQDLVVVDGAGARAHPIDADGRFGEPVALARRARNELRMPAPTLAGIAFDVVGDGRADLVLPGDGVTEVWTQANPDAAAMRRVQQIPVDVERSWIGKRTFLSDGLESRVEVPAPDLRDLNGDGRDDLVVVEGERHRFFLQDEDGRFADTPIEVDLSTFVDTTPRASLELGETLVLGDRQHLRRGDVDGDGIPDHVICHRRKVWTFLSTADGPQFRSPRIARVAADVSAFVLVDIDEDGRSDLLLFRVEAPSAASLALGLVTSFEISIEATGYPTDADGRFARRPGWQRELTVRVPALLSLLDRVDEYTERFVDLAKQARFLAFGSFDATAGEDVAVVAADGDRIEVRPTAVGAERDLAAAQRRAVRNVLFEDPRTDFDIDRLFDVVAGLVDARARAIVGDGAPRLLGALRDPAQFRIRDLTAADFDGDGRDEILLVYEDAETGTQWWFDVLGTAPR